MFAALVVLPLLQSNLLTEAPVRQALQEAAGGIGRGNQRGSSLRPAGTRLADPLPSPRPRSMAAPSEPMAPMRFPC
jgi:hypothetical protein